MKKKELPQDKSALENFTKELCYVKNENGEYDTELSRGWSVKKAALDNAWEEIEEKVEEAANLVKSGKRSPVYYFMVKKLMNVGILAAYTGFMKWKVKRHLKPKHFSKLKSTTLQTYADVFEIEVNELKEFKGEID